MAIDSHNLVLSGSEFEGNRALEVAGALLLDCHTLPASSRSPGAISMTTRLQRREALSTGQTSSRT